MTKPIKHIVVDARTRRSSGVGRYVDRLIEHLQTLDKTNLYTIVVEPTDDWQPAASNFTALPCAFKRFSFNPLDQFTFARFLRALKPDLVHFAITPQEPLFYFGARITTTHDLTMLGFTRAGRLPLPIHWLRMAGYRVLFWASHRVSKQILVPTEWVAKDVASLHPFTKDRLVVTLEATEPALAVASEPMPEIAPPFIMHAGSPFPHKNIERLIDAFELLKLSHTDLKLVLAGKKEFYFQQLEPRIRSSTYASDIIVPGFISDAQLKWLYEQTAAYVLPSMSEGFGLPGLEAMTHGAPLVSSNATCLPEVYGDAAEYFDPYDVSDIASAIDRVISDAGRSKDLIIAGKAQVKKFSWKTMARQTIDVYENVLKEK